jgi:hypothetical protein
MLQTGCNFARLKRLTLIVRAGKIEEALYLVFPPNESAEQVLEWLTETFGLTHSFGVRSTAKYCAALRILA